MLRRIASLLLITITPSFGLELKDGDLILRLSEGLIANQYSKLSDHPSGFSHIGVYREGRVHHIESKTLFSKNDYHQDRLKDYLGDSKKWGIYRSDYGDEIAYALNRYKNQKISFDFFMRLDNKDLYCTEFIYLLLESIIQNSVKTEVPYSRTSGVSVGNILRASEFNFKPISIDP